MNASKTCSGYLGAQIGAMKHDGRKYRCVHPKDCMFRHVIVSEKSSSQLLDIVASTPSGIRSDSTKAIDCRTKPNARIAVSHDILRVLSQGDRDDRQLVVLSLLHVWNVMSARRRCSAEPK
jgi:hypothetical protein